MTHQVRIGNYVVGSGQPVAVIAEFGINANGYPDLLKTMTDEAHALNIPFVKIQTRSNTRGELTDVYPVEELRKPRSVPREILENGVRRGVFPEEDRIRLSESGYTSVTTWDQKRAIEFTKEETSEFVRYAKSLGMVGFSSPWCLGAIEVLEDVGVEVYKVASPMATNSDMLAAMARTGKPVILSTGMMDMPMVEAAVETLVRNGCEDRLIIMHCTSVYGATPAKPGDHGRSMLNLRCIETFKRRFDPIPIGFSANDPGLEPMKMAAALGAVMLEKHVTLLRTMYGSDQASSVEFRELAAPLRVIAEVPDVLGDGVKTFYEAEREVAKKLRR
ncbi:N-acetylneuraminate synthase family protein [Patescibacteria group bacterium]|nr:N-acetylneuraminate synthase family protein [Patescibacteria group bacterium]